MTFITVINSNTFPNGSVEVELTGIFTGNLTGNVLNATIIESAKGQFDTIEAATLNGTIVISDNICIDASNSLSVDTITSKTMGAPILIGNLDANCGNIANVQAIYVNDVYGKSGGAVNFQNELNMDTTGVRMTFTDGIVIGDTGTTSTNTTDVAIGKAADTTGGNGVSIGQGAQSTGARAVAIGFTAAAAATGAIAIGDVATATTGVGVIAIGDAAASTATGAIAVGDSATTSVADAIAIGRTALADAVDAIAIGQGADAGGNSAIAIGMTANASTNGSVAIGDVAVATGTGAIAIGDGAVATGTNNAQIGEAVDSGGVASLQFRSQNVIDETFINAARYVVSNDETGNMVKGGDAIIEGNLSVNGGAAILGNLTISGNLVTVDTENITIQDNKIILNSGEVGTGVTLGAAGIEIERGTEPNYNFCFDETRDVFVAGFGNVTASLDKITQEVDGVSANGIPFFNGDGLLTTDPQLTFDVANNTVVVETVCATTSVQTDTISDKNAGFITVTDPMVFSTTGDQIRFTDGIEIGDSGTNTTNTTDVAVGKAADATGGNGVAMGQGAQSTGASAIAIGLTTTSSGVGSIAIGDVATSSIAGGIAIGDNATTTTGAHSIAIGSETDATSAGGIAVGRYAQATTGAYAIAIGGGATTGAAADATAADAIALGRGTTADAANTIAIGQNADAGGAQGIAIGNGTSAAEIDTIAIGTNASASAQDEIRIGNPIPTSTTATATAFGQIFQNRTWDDGNIGDCRIDGTGNLIKVDLTTQTANIICAIQKVETPRIEGKTASITIGNSMVFDTTKTITTDGIITDAITARTGNTIVFEPATNTFNGNITVLGTLTACNQKYCRTEVSTSTYTIVETDDIIAANTLANAIVMTLPLISTLTDGLLQVKIVDEGGNASANNITINTSGSDTIFGGTTTIIAGDYNAIQIYSDGTNKWFMY